MLDLEWSAVGLPAVGLLALKSANDFLLEQPELVVDAIAITGHVERGQRLEEACGQATKSAIAEPCIRLAVENFVEAHTETGKHSATELLNAQVRDVVAQRPAHEKFHGKVVEPLRVDVAEARLGLEHAIHDAVANREGDGLQIVDRFEFGDWAHEGVLDMVQDGVA